MVKIGFSILSCNMVNIRDSVLKAERGGADLIHVDIMDGHYVKNFSFGPQTIKDLKKITNLPIEAHLEIDNPIDFIDIFANAGADIITVQLDCCIHPLRIFNTIKKFDKKVGVAINPTEEITRLQYFLNFIDQILLMSVEPGFGGQKFEYITFNKIKNVKNLLKKNKINIPIAIDGGINLEICKELKKLNINILIAGSSVFLSKNIESSIINLKNI